MKRLFLAIMMALFFFVGSGCSVIARVNAKEINENSNFEIELLAKLEDVDFQNFQVIDGFGTQRYYDKKYGDFEDEPSQIDNYPHVSYDVSGFPDTLGERYVTGIHCSDPNIELFGCSVGDKALDFKVALEKRNFKKNEERGSLYFEVYEKGRIEIRFRIEYDKKEEAVLGDFTIAVDSTNLFLVMY